MSFFSRLGSKITHAGNSIGKKAGALARKGVKVVAENAAQVATVANSVSKVSGALATGAAMVGLEPVAAGLAAVSAGAKGVSKVADVAGGAARGMVNASDAVRHGGQAIDKLRKGNISGAIASADVAAKFGSAAATRAGTFRKEIQRPK
tara:strand:- start:4549 stop:4995 length:447 start_codon:yes stop_codon:yes gene_type:complete